MTFYKIGHNIIQLKMLKIKQHEYDNKKINFCVVNNQRMKTETQLI